MSGVVRTIAFFGVGLMGVPMIRRLAGARHLVHAWNRTFDKAKAIEAPGITAFADPRAAAEDADVAITMLSDGPAVASLIRDRGLVDALRKGSVLVDMSSTSPDEARASAALLASGGVGFCDAPVSGGPPGAETGTLAIMAGGDAEIFETVRPVLACMGRPVRIGGVGTGQLAKLANQLIVGAAIAAVSEAILLVREGGGDADAFRDALTGGYADSKVLQMHGERMVAGDFEARGRAALHLKDIGNILREAEMLGLRLPLCDMIGDRFARLCGELGGANLDHSALFLELLDLNGRPIPRG